VTTALILAGGLGERMGGQLPKPLVPIRGVPLLERCLLGLLRVPLERIVVAVSNRRPEVVDFAQTRLRSIGKVVGVEVETLLETSPLGTIGAAARLAGRCEELLTVYADNLTLLDYRELLRAHRDASAALTLAVHAEPIASPFGEIEIANGEVLAYHEKPERRPLIASAASVLSARALASLKPERAQGLPDLFQTLRSDGERVAAHPHEAPWVDVNDPGQVRRAEELVAGHAEGFDCWAKDVAVEVVGLLLEGPDGLWLEERPQDATLYPAQWDTPGGKIEPGELPEHAMLREAREELGVDLGSAQCVGVFDDVDKCSSKIVRHHVFVASAAGHSVRPAIGQRLRCVPATELASLADRSRVLDRSLACARNPADA
jgi:ADP-ribose pyrophosphatase YjhB (NUDIX family)/molybdopterin-guanine dinucleotide biosynthesis protein A